jgi:alanine racemase
MTTPQRWAWAEVDLAAIAHNVGVLRSMAAPSELWAVVKADGYGHGAVQVGRAALAAGAAGLCVALTQEGIELRKAGITAPILLLSEQPADNAATVVANDLTPTVYTVAAVRALADAVGTATAASPYPVHVKVDTGMHRVGVAPADLDAILHQLDQVSHVLRVDGIFTHMAVADDPGNAYNQRQLERFSSLITPKMSGRTHAANSAGLMAHPAARRDMVRGGIAIYGISPGPGVDELASDLRPALSLKAKVSFVKRLGAGDAISYGLRHTFSSATNVVTVPLGYADGVPRRLFAVGGAVLIGGKRRNIVGAVTMDQLMVDCADDEVDVGDEVVLIGRQRDEEITAAEWATRLDTIAYEIVCGISKRVPRVYAIG